MDPIQAAVAELFEVMGLGQRVAPKSGHAAVSIQELGQLHFEQRERELVLYLAQPVEVGADRTALQIKALERVHFENLHPYPVQSAMNDDALVFVTRLTETEINLQTLEHAVGMLSDLHGQTRQ